MGVQARIVLYAPDSSSARRAAGAAFDRIAHLDGVMSDYRSDSELMQLCAGAGQGPVPVSDDLFTVLQQATDLAGVTNGAFDITVGPLVRLWREARRAGALPSPGELLEAQSRVGWRHVTLDSLRQTAALALPGMQLDLGAIAKGYAADEAIAAMRATGISRVLIEFGGDIVVGDPPPESKGWEVTIALVGDENRGAGDLADDLAGGTLVLANSAVSSSGDTEQFVEIDGKRYSHVVDPRTGLGLTDRVAATVVAPRGALSDALATALSILGPEPGLELVDRAYPSVRAHLQYLE